MYLSTVPDDYSRYIAQDFADYIQVNRMDHVRATTSSGAGQDRALASDPQDPHSTQNYFLPGDLEIWIEAFVEHEDHRRYHKGLDSVTSAAADFDRATAIAQHRRVMRKAIPHRRLLHSGIAA